MSGFVSTIAVDLSANHSLAFEVARLTVIQVENQELLARSRLVHDLHEHLVSSLQGGNRSANGDRMSLDNAVQPSLVTRIFAWKYSSKVTSQTLRIQDIELVVHLQCGSDREVTTIHQELTSESLVGSSLKLNSSDVPIMVNLLSFFTPNVPNLVESRAEDSLPF